MAHEDTASEQLVQDFVRSVRAKRRGHSIMITGSVSLPLLRDTGHGTRNSYRGVTAWHILPVSCRIVCSPSQAKCTCATYEKHPNVNTFRLDACGVEVSLKTSTSLGRNRTVSLFLIERRGRADSTVVYAWSGLLNDVLKSCEENEESKVHMAKAKRTHGFAVKAEVSFV